MCMISLYDRASFDCTARLWDSVTGDCLKVFTDHTNYVFALSFSPDGSLLASGGGDGTLVMYDVKVSRTDPVNANGKADCGGDPRTDVDLVVWRKDWHFRD